MSAAARRPSLWQMGLLTLVILSSARGVAAQTLTVNAAGDALRVQAHDLAFIAGPLLNRLKEGRSVRLDFELTMLSKPEGPIVKQVVQAFTLSFDLWEERFAVSRAGSPPRSISHLRAIDAENWCLDNLTMSISSLGIGRDTPFWLRLVYRVQDLEPVTEEAPGERYTLRALIDRLSRRREEADLAKSVSAGPFRLP
ncbi:MAG TPA: hypothetical protein VFB99_22195 [Vicinamibacterales bacterium]|nr:hypothetical protein [Vicinamibacterales bacterium]